MVISWVNSWWQQFTSWWDNLPVKTRLLISCLAFGGTLLFGALCIGLYERRRRRHTTQESSASDQLAHFRSLYEQGELSPEEFKRIRTLLGGRLRTELKVEKPPIPAPESQPNPPQAPEAGNRPDPPA